MDTKRNLIGRWVADSANAKGSFHTSVRGQANEWLFQVLGNELEEVR
jgi:hypothetical protein